MEAGEKAEVKVVPLVKTIAVNFGYQAGFNTVYAYDEHTNSYLRSYGNGEPHLAYTCPAGLGQVAPQKDCNSAIQVAPKVVVAMVVEESTAWDNYHQNITAIGSGKAYVFQNGTATEAIWSKASAKAQIEFKDAAGNIISFTPGQLWIAAIPNGVGSIKY